MDGLDFSEVRDVLDLGCGFGFWTGSLVRQVAPEARFTGMDACDGNEGVYVHSIRESGHQARFICTNLVARLPFDTGSFDLILSAYSLYFFVDILPEVARVLKPSGRFLAVTHSESSFAGLLAALGLEGGDSPLLQRISRFSAENGSRILGRCFGQIQRVDYLNTLSFGQEDRGNFLAYLQFKLPLLKPGACYEQGLPASVVQRATASLRRLGRVEIQKDDALFICGDHGGKA